MAATAAMLKARKRLEHFCFVGMVGAQNAGKSTLVHALAGVQAVRKLSPVMHAVAHQCPELCCMLYSGYRPQTTPTAAYVRLCLSANLTRACVFCFKT